MGNCGAIWSKLWAVVSLAQRFSEGESTREAVQIETFVSISNQYRSVVSSGDLYTVNPSHPYLYTVDLTVAFYTRPIFNPQTSISQNFVREFSQNAIVPLANLTYYSYLSSANGNLRPY
jgi:hypothetical protein